MTPSPFSPAKPLGWIARGLVGVLLACASPPDAEPARPARVMGATEMIHLPEAGLDFRAVIDTGAHTSSIHAVEIAVAQPAPEMRDDVGKLIDFRVVNADGGSRRLRGRISDVVEVCTSHGCEARYSVPLRLRWRDVEKQVQVNLRDRTPMSFKLLLGRDWLRGDFLVDVDRNPVE